MLYHVVAIYRNIKGMACKHEELGGTVAKAQEVIEEEVVQLVWAYKVFCLMLPFSSAGISSGDIGVSMMSSNVVRDCSSTLLSAT